MTIPTPLHAARLKYAPKLPIALADLSTARLALGKGTGAVNDEGALRKLFPLTFGQPMAHVERGERRKGVAKRVGVVLSGGQAPGGHNVIAGLFDALIQLSQGSQLVGFLNGPSGIVDNQAKPLTADLLSHYRNMGGFDIIGSGRTKIESEEQLRKSLETVKALKLDGLVVIGGDDSNTNAAILAEYFKREGLSTSVIGVPKTIDGDLKNEQIEVSFGHDTACRVYSELIGNLMRDCLSAKKYYHFVKLMGRSASHITLECALQTQPTVALIGEEIAAQKKTLRQITAELVEVIRKRGSKKYGVILVPEGLIEFIPEMGDLINQLNDLLSHSSALEGKGLADQLAYLKQHLKGGAVDALLSLPPAIQSQLLLDRDPHGNVQVSRIETEQLLIATCTAELGKLNAHHHFFGYEGRSAMPTNFDAQYCYALGFAAALLIQEGLTGYMASVRDLYRPTTEWKAGGVPITMMMNLERRHGKEKPVIQKALVDLKGAPFREFALRRGKWAEEDAFRYPGPIQYFGEERITDSLPATLSLEKKG
ncbi:MAG: diphosphate--fructose-6-phosphate 1-phosphotransferase [Parachlamydiales bacterium]